MKVTNPHDKYFKEVFSNTEEAVDFLKGSLSSELVKNIDFENLKPLKDSFIDDALKENFSDLVYSAKYKGKTEILITLLFEHKSQPERYPHLQLLRYMLKLWDANIKEKKKLVPVVPIVFYHGKKRWNNKPFEKYFKGIDSHLLPYLPEFEYLLTDLSQYSNEEIFKKYNEIKVQTALLLMKNIFDEARLKNVLPSVFYGIKKIENTETGEKFFSAAIYYLFNFVEKINVNEVAETIKNITPKGGDIAMTIAARLKQEGLQKGLQKGRQEGLQEGLYEARKESVINLFRTNDFTLEQIAIALKLDLKFITKVLTEAKLIYNGH